MNRCIAVLITAAACVAITSGCGRSNGLYPVTGKVLYNGAPATGATVSFVPKGAAEGQQADVPLGVVNEDGTFTLAGPRGEGAAAGEYVVLIAWKEGAGKVKGRSPALNAPDRLKGRYLNPSRPLLRATVKPESNDLAPFEVK
jgi:hypothetical protein